MSPQFPTEDACKRCGFAPCMCSAAEKAIESGGSRPMPPRRVGATPYPSIDHARSLRDRMGMSPPTKVSALAVCLDALEPLDEEDRVRVVDALVALVCAG